METAPFLIHYNLGADITAEIRSCCREDNVVDYAVWVANKLAFTITKDPTDLSRWTIALKNADDIFPDELVQAIGQQVEAQCKKAHS